MPKLPEQEPSLDPYWSTADGRHVRLYHGNVTDVLARLPEKSVHCCVTSPPYWGLRDYGTGTWVGGDAKCDHVERTKEDAHKTSTLGPTAAERARGDLRREHPAENAAFKATARQFAERCKKCGAKRIDQQIGAEPSPDCGTHGQAQCGRCFVCSMVAVFRGVYQVLRDDGVVWLNLGDSYSGGTTGRMDGDRRNKQGIFTNGNYREKHGGGGSKARPPTDVPSGNLVGIPWRVALALQADGWILRQDIIWAKPAPMPESVRNRCTKSHEYVFLLAKQMKYFYDAEAIKEKTSDRSQGQRTTKGYNTAQRYGAGNGGNGGLDAMADRLNSGEVVSSNKRSVWTISSGGYQGCHFAVFPPKLIEPMIRAGTSEKGCCSVCAAPWRRVLDRSGAQKIEGPSEHERDRSFRSSRNGVDSTLDGEVGTYKTVGWEPGCACKAGVVPCTVLDPFIGSGTTCEVSIELGRTSVGVDLSDRYLRNNAIPRIEGTLLRRPDTAKLIKRKHEPFKPNGKKLGILKR